MEFVRSLDAYPKLKAEDQVRTTHGACLSIVALATMAYLFASELRFYSKVEVMDRLSVNSTHGEHLKVKFDLAFPHVPCDLLSLDALDSAGQKQDGVTHHIFKTKIDSKTDASKSARRDGSVKVVNLGTLQHEHELESAGVAARDAKDNVPRNPDGSECGNCYGAGRDGDCCNTCDQVRSAYANKGWSFHPEDVDQCKGEMAVKSLAATGEEGCNIHGDLDLSTVNGNFHFAPGHTAAHGAGQHLMTIQDLIQQTFETFNITHEIKGLSFGNHYPGVVNPLDRERRAVEDGHGMYQYYLKVVPTVYKYLDGREVVSNQYSVTEHLRHINVGAGRGLPGVWFFYEVSPVHAVFEETRRSKLEFLSSVCGLLGGVFTICGLFEGGLGHAMRRLGLGGPALGR